MSIVDQNQHADPDVVEIVDSIKKRLPSWMESPSGEEPCTIFRVPEELRQADENWYEPQVISIGPYHHGKEKLKPKERQKLKHLQSILGRNGNRGLEDYAKRIKELEERARKCYSGNIEFEGNKLVEMMLLDGCFLVETLLQFEGSWRPTGYIPNLCGGKWFAFFMDKDMLLLENQLPFFVLECIFRLVVPRGVISSMAYLAINGLRKFQFKAFNEAASMKSEYHHLLDVYHHHCLPTPIPDTNNSDSSAAGACSSIKLRLVTVKDHLPCFSCVPSASNALIEQVSSTIPSAEDLQAAGVKFKRQERTGGFIDIKFDKNGVIKIPYFGFAEGVIRGLKNAIAYEQCSYPNISTHFTSYAIFMDNIINTPKDVQILRQSGILEHAWGSDKDFALLFNKMQKGLMWDDGHLVHLCEDVNGYCGTNWHVWRANLVQNYFNTPWAILSFAAAILLLLLTATQTIFTVFPR